MPLPSEISQRDLRSRSREIMDAVERGESFTVTRDGHQIGELIPLRRTRRFVPADEFIELGRGLDPIDPVEFRSDIDTAADPYADDPYDRQ
jgi:antitoxin (DNA-binding transcriptional repressor) of toxin-antitoxin stability system